MIHISAGGAFLVEVVLTAVFVFVILGVTSRMANAATAGLVIGLHADLRPPGRHPPRRHLGQPGPQPGPGPRRGGHGTQPGLAVHRGAAGRRHRRCRVYLIIYPSATPEPEVSLDPEATGQTPRLRLPDPAGRLTPTTR